jgi:hypothetical protein
MSAAINSGVLFCASAKGATPAVRSRARKTVRAAATSSLPFDDQFYHRSASSDSKWTNSV